MVNVYPVKCGNFTYFMVLYRIFCQGGKLDWGDSSERGTVFIYIKKVYILMFSVQVVIKFQGGNMSGGISRVPPLYKTLNFSTNLRGGENFIW